MLAYPKPERRRVLKRRAKRQQHLTRAQCRQIVYRRERMMCQRCQRKLSLDVYPPDPRFPHVNEKVPRSKGGDPLDPDNQELLCGTCHLPGGQHAPTVARMHQIQARLKRKAS